MQVLAREMKLLKLGHIALDGTQDCGQREQAQGLVLGAGQQNRSATAPGGADAAGVGREDRSRGHARRHGCARRDRLNAITQTKTKRDAGKKPRGKDPEPPEAGLRDKDQVNLTDDESRIMPSSGGGFGQSYNAQAAVDTDTVLVVVAHVTQGSNDKRQIVPTLGKIADLPQGLGHVQTLLADTGYFSAANVRACEAQGIVPMLSMKREPHHVPVLQRFAADTPRRQPTTRPTRWRIGWRPKPDEPCMDCANKRWSRCSGSSNA